MLAISTILLSGCSLSDIGINQQQKNEKIDKHSFSKFQSSVQPFFASQNQQDQQKDAQQVNLYMITKQLKNNYKKLFKVEFQENKDQINLTPTDKQVIKIIKYAKQDNASAIKAWNNFVHGVKKTSISVSENSKDNQAKMIIFDPINNHQLYIVQNGKTLFNKFK